MTWPHRAARPRRWPLGRRRRGLRGDFDRFFQSYAVSLAGSSIGASALPLIAILVLHSSAFAVSLLVVISSLSSALVSVLLGVLLDRSEKRRALITTDLIACLALLTVPVAAALGRLTYPQLCVIAAVHSTCRIASAAVGAAYIKAVVTPQDRTTANARLESLGWTTQTAGPPAGGALIGLAGPTITAAADAVSYLASALLLRRLPRSQPATCEGPASRHRARDMFAGWRLILGHPGLRIFYANMLVFGGAYQWISPLLVVYMLTDLGASPTEYGLVIGLPCLGGILGAALAPRLATRWGEHRFLLAVGVARTVWLLPMPLVHGGVWAIVVIGVCNTGLLICSGSFNPVFATYRMAITPDPIMARVATAWSVSARSIQPAFIAVGGVVAAWTSPRLSLVAGGIVCLVSAVILPWRASGE